MTYIAISLPSEIETALLEKASANGKNIQNYIEDLLKKQALHSVLDELRARAAGF